MSNVVSNFGNGRIQKPPVLSDVQCQSRIEFFRGSTTILPKLIMTTTPFSKITRSILSVRLRSLSTSTLTEEFEAIIDVRVLSRAPCPSTTIYVAASWRARSLISGTAGVGEPPKRKSPNIATDDNKARYRVFTYAPNVAPWCS